VFSHIPLGCFSKTVYGCACFKCNLQFEMANLTKWCIYVTFCCKVWKPTSKTQEPKSVFLVMTQKKNSSHLSGKACPLHIWIKPGKSGQNITGIFVTYFDCEGAVHQYLSLKAKTLTRIITERFCNLWSKRSTINVENNGGTRRARLTMTMHWHKILCQCNNSKILETRLHPPHPSYCLDLAPWVPEIQEQALYVLYLTPNTV